MTGVILAAGSGTRLNGNDVVRPKCLAAAGGAPLIERQLQALRSTGIDRVAVVVGFQADLVRAACGSGVRFVDNTAFAETNSLYSLWLARPLLTEGFIVMNCDVLFDPAMLSDLLTARYEDALLVSYPEPGQPPFGDEEMKVKVRRGCVVDISKTLPPEETDAENVGIAKFGADGAALLIRLMEPLIAAGAGRDWAPRSFREFAKHRPLYAIGTRGLPWIDIDTPEDYRRAIEDVLPWIDATEPKPAAARALLQRGS
jgi:choline kinase